MGQGGGGGGSEGWLDSGDTWNVEPTEFAYGLDIRKERERGVKEDST